jgi:hypothetical protein
MNMRRTTAVAAKALEKQLREWFARWESGGGT